MAFDSKGVVHLLCAIDGDAYEPVVVMKELAPLGGEKGTVGLNAVLNNAAIGVFTLQLECLAIEGEGAQHRLAAVPREEYVAGSLHGDVLLDVLL